MSNLSKLPPTQAFQDNFNSESKLCEQEVAIQIRKKPKTQQNHVTACGGLGNFCCDLISLPHKTHTPAFDSDIRVLFLSSVSVTQNLLEKIVTF